MRERSNIIIEYGTYMLAYFFSYVASLARMPFLAASILIVEALFLYVHWVRESGSLVELRALFTLAWLGGQGLACLQLSKLQTKWHIMTWICFFAVYIAFGIGYEWKQEFEPKEKKEIEKNQIRANRLYRCMLAVLGLSVAAFVTEVVILGFVPILSDKPHAYSSFHVSGVHYFTVSCILIPAISVLWIKTSERIDTVKKVVAVIANVTAVAIPIICVSRFQLLFAVGFAMVTYIAVSAKVKMRTLIILVLAIIPVYVILTVFRHHDVAYLNGIFEMKWDKMPIFITQPYMYVVNNFENFNCMVEQLTEHTWGIRMLFPVIALTGLKFVFPQLVSSVNYITKPELTTLTMFYDAYYDFGIVGVFALALIIGKAAQYLVKRIKECENPVIFLLYGQMAIYLGLAFFTVWFSIPTTWFWFVMTGIMYFYVGYDDKKKGRDCADENS